MKGPGIENINPRSILSRMKPYTPGKPIWEVQREFGITQVTKLASNENPLGPSPLLWRLFKLIYLIFIAIQMRRLLILERLLRKNVDLRLIKSLLRMAEMNSLHSSPKLTWNLVMRSLCPHQHLASMNSEPTYLVLALFRYRSVRTYRYEVEAILAAVTERTKMLYICSPNNPTGTYMKKTDLHRLVKSLPSHVLVIFDGAYSHFVTADDYCDGLALVREGFPVVVLQTFSKIYGLAGIRVGYGIADAGILQRIRQVKEPFNVNMLAQVGAAAAIKDDQHLEATRSNNAKVRERALHRIACFSTPFHAKYE